MLDTIKCRFPCGGSLEVKCFRNNDAGCAVGKENFNRFFIPEVRCKGRYVEGEGCPWFEELRKFYERMPGEDASVVDADGKARIHKSYVKYRDWPGPGIVERKLRSGLVVWRGKVLDDAHFPPVLAKTEQKFECCNKKSFHAGIISKFIAWLKGG